LYDGKNWLDNDNHQGSLADLSVDERSRTPNIQGTILKELCKKKRKKRSKKKTDEAIFTKKVIVCFVFSLGFYEKLLLLHILV